MKVKVCGIRRKEDLKALAPICVDFIGFVFYPPSKRYAGGNAQELMQVPLCAETRRVGVFVNENPDIVIEICNQHQLDFAQLHGSETPNYCNAVSKSVKVIKAFNVDASFNFKILTEYDAICDYFLFDAKGKLPGGNSTTYDWSILSRYEMNKPFFLSGGIRPQHVQQLKSFNHPSLFAVDINSGFETSPGEKDTRLISEFSLQLKQPA